MTETAERSPGPLRVAVLWPQLSGYVHTALRALADRGVDLLVFHEIGSSVTPFDVEAVTRGLTAHAWSGSPDESELDEMLRGFEPDVLLVMSWENAVYRRIGRRWRGRALRVLCLDEQWWGTRPQRGVVAASRLMIQPTYDAAFVAGDRQADFARRLGFPTELIVPGLYTGDYGRFAEVDADRESELPPPAFLFVGRLVADNGVDTLAAGYHRYRAQAVDPWPLLVAGAGPDERLLDGLAGVETLGFVPPTELPEVFARAGCVVAPSRFAPWGVVVHEATAAGLPVVCTWVMGAALRLVLDGYNGVVTSPDDPPALADALARVSSATDEERRAMGEASGLLARQYTPQRWADRLLRRLPALRTRAGLPPLPAGALAR
jgi:glycosyltransferase involved in cell wall biosynthesis